MGDWNRETARSSTEIKGVEIQVHSAARLDVRFTAWLPGREACVGAKFAFRRKMNGTPVLTKDCENITLELLEVTGADSRLRAIFAVKPMIIGAFNHANFQQPGNIIGTRTFGVISNAENAREIEVAIKYSF